MDEQPKNFTVSKIAIAIGLFVGIGFAISTFLNYNQNIATQHTLQEKAVVGDQNLELNKQHLEQLKLLLEKVTNLENKLDNLEKTGKLTK